MLNCFSCGYDVDHPGVQCPNPKMGHIPNVQRNEVNLCPRASMKGQHKTAPDGTGAGLGWNMAQNTNKSFYTMGKQGQQPWAKLYGQGQQGGQLTGGCGRRNRGGG